MSLHRNSQNSPEEQHLLTQDYGDSKKHSRTPLPLFQFSIVLYLRFCDALARYVIEPFINELLLSFADGDEGTVAYLASVMDISLYATSFATVLYWNRLSDTAGRKPIVVLGMIAITVSTLLVGLSTTFWAFVLSRCISSTFNQSGTVTRCIIDEITDESNSADAFALLNVPWALGMLIGPLMGGYLSNPNNQFPEVFSGRLWEQFPYLLPCATIALVTTPGLLTLCIWFRETLPSKPSNVDSADDERTRTVGHQKTPLRSLLIPRVILAMANDILFTSLHAAYAAVYPLFLAMSPSVGGLGLPPSQIGLILAARGLFGSFAQALVVGPAVRKFSLGRVFTTAMISYIPTFLLFPLMNVYAKDAPADGNSTSHSIMWMLLILHFVFIATVESGYTCMYIYVLAAAPNRGTLGAVNGLTEISVMGAKLAGSAFSTFMLGMSIKKGWMGGHAVYVLLSIVACGSIFVVRRLPRHAKDWSDRNA